MACNSSDQVQLECIHSHVPPVLMQLQAGQDAMVGAIDVASNVVETPEKVGQALEFVPQERLYPCMNCGLTPLSREVPWRKFKALVKGIKLAKARVALQQPCDFASFTS